jgi:DNA-binding NarL/FixJ family response regulator
VIVICDDDSFERDNLERSLRKITDIDHIIQTSSCHELIGVLREHKSNGKFPKVVFVDTLMIGTNGIDCMKLISQEFPPFPLVAVCGGATPAHIAHAFRANANVCIEKPYDSAGWDPFVESITRLLLQTHPEWSDRRRGRDAEPRDECDTANCRNNER